MEDDELSGEWDANRDLNTGTDIRSVFIPAGSNTYVKFMPSGGAFSGMETIYASSVGG